MLKNKSEVNTISNPEFINLTPLDLNPLMSSCEIKVFYLGHNRNGSYIDKSTALEMARTLRGTPIVAAWNKKKEDFGDHGHIVHIEDGEVTFDCKTIPYGFVSPDAEVWFKNFIDTDEFGNKVERTYLMTTGYLWTGQFEELTKVIEEGQPHSMELDEKTLEGHWAEDSKLGVEFFIINDATFSKLCILGDDVEPCFEGSSVTSPQVSSKFSKTLFTMMNELTETLSSSKGGLNVDSKDENVVEETPEQVVESELQEETENAAVVENEEVTEVETEMAAADDVAETVETDTVEEDKADFTEEVEAVEDTVEEVGDFTNIPTEEFEAMNAELESLRAEIKELREFKLDVENQQKDELINSFYMLSNEDKADVIEHKSEYSMDEIKSKLSVIYVEKKVDFNANEEVDEVTKDEPAITFSLEEETNVSTLSSLQAALRNISKN